ncbi:glycosyltransferase family 4 protein [Candidatus Bathyarchaeota archaeon]|nr:glycosyltransferase family 4 protein [Candidatus Bathyarchaeota archaeon]
MRVAVVVDNPNYFGGGNKFASDLIKMLKMYNHDVALCAWEKPVEGKCYESFLDIEEVYLPSFLTKKIKGKLWKIAFASSSAIKKCMKKFKPNIIINANVEPAAFRGIKAAKKVFYCHFPTELKVYKYTLLYLLYRVPYWFWHYKEIEAIDAIVCNSYYTKNIAYLCWKHHVPKDKFHVIYPAVDISAFRREIRREEKICYVGRIDANKGIDYVIDAFLEVYDKINISLEIVGGVSSQENVRYYEGILKPRVDALRRKGFPIKLEVNVPYSRIAETLLSSKAMVSFNPEEHFGIVPVEAQAAGCPPIVARGGGQLETVKHCETGFLVENPQEISSYLVALFEDNKLWSKISESARKWASKFSLENIAREWDALLSSLSSEVH